MKMLLSVAITCGVLIAIPVSGAQAKNPITMANYLKIWDGTWKSTTSNGRGKVTISCRAAGSASANCDVTIKKQNGKFIRTFTVSADWKPKKKQLIWKNGTRYLYTFRLTKKGMTVDWKISGGRRGKYYVRERK